MYIAAAITLFLALTAVLSAVRDRAGAAAPKVSARDVDMAGKAPRPGARDRYATVPGTLSGAPVPSWG